MYQSFYRLKRNPFENCPDPFFFYPTPNHQEALTALYYGVQTRKGFLMLTGEVGTGKTLLMRCMANVFNRAHIGFAYVVNPRLLEREFLGYIITDLGLKTETRDKTTMLFQLNDYLLSKNRTGSTIALIVDEAHLLSWEVLEEIRLLTNLETPNHKLLQIILVGQPELDQTIDSLGLRQLKQRIALRRKLLPLTAEQIEHYVRRRLELCAVSVNEKEIFSQPAITAIEKYSRGVPRLVNTICENALMVGYAMHSPTITAEIVEEVATEFGLLGPKVPSSPEEKSRPAGTLRRTIQAERPVRPIFSAKPATGLS